MPFALARPLSGAPGRYRLPRGSRIRRGSEIRAILGTGRRRRSENFDLFTQPSAARHARFGTIVPKHRRGIVERNRLKRRIREVGRTTILPALAGTDGGFDLLVRARPGAYELTYQQIRAEITTALQDSP